MADCQSINTGINELRLEKMTEQDLKSSNLITASCAAMNTDREGIAILRDGLTLGLPFIKNEALKDRAVKVANNIHKMMDLIGKSQEDFLSEVEGSIDAKKTNKAELRKLLKMTPEQFETRSIDNSIWELLSGMQKALARETAVFLKTDKPPAEAVKIFTGIESLISEMAQSILTKPEAKLPTNK